MLQNETPMKDGERQDLSENKETEQKVSAVCSSREDARKNVGKLVKVLLFNQWNCTNVNFLSDYYNAIRRYF